MGSMFRVRYKKRRGIHEAGSEVLDAKDWFEIFVEDDFDDFKPRYDGLP